MEANTPFPNISPGGAMVYTTLEKVLLSNDALDKLVDLNLVAFVAHEAHKVARSDKSFGQQWTEVGICRQRLPNVPWYTCTATPRTLEQQAIINCLHLQNTVQVRGILYREEIWIDFHHYTQPVKPQRAVMLLNLVVPLIRGKTLIYFSNIEKCTNMVNMLKNKEFKVASFTAATPSSACETILKDLAQ